MCTFTFTTGEFTCRFLIPPTFRMPPPCHVRVVRVRSRAPVVAWETCSLRVGICPWSTTTTMQARSRSSTSRRVSEHAVTPCHVPLQSCITHGSIFAVYWKPSLSVGCPTDNALCIIANVLPKNQCPRNSDGESSWGRCSTELAFCNHTTRVPDEYSGTRGVMHAMCGTRIPYVLFFRSSHRVRVRHLASCRTFASRATQPSFNG